MIAGLPSGTDLQHTLPQQTSQVIAQGVSTVMGSVYRQHV